MPLKITERGGVKIRSFHYFCMKISFCFELTNVPFSKLLCPNWILIVSMGIMSTDPLLQKEKDLFNLRQGEPGVSLGEDFVRWEFQSRICLSLEEEIGRTGDFRVPAPQAVGGGELETQTIGGLAPFSLKPD